MRFAAGLLPSRAGSACSAKVGLTLRRILVLTNDGMPEPSFICVACEGKKKYSFVGHDVNTHDLVRCSVLVETAEVVLEERLADIETRLGQHQAHIDDKLAAMELKMGEHLSRLDQKMSDMESLLRELVYTMGARTKPSSTLPAYPHTSITAPSYIESYPYSQ